MGWSAGVRSFLQCAWAGLWSDCGLDRSSFLPSASTHQHHQVHHPLLLQEGKDVALTQTFYTLETVSHQHPALVLSLTLYDVSIVTFPQITLFYNCQPALKTFRSTTSAFFFLVVLLFGWGLATAVMVYSVAE